MERYHSKTTVDRPKSISGIGKVMAIKEYIAQDQQELSFVPETLIFLKVIRKKIFVLN